MRIINLTLFLIILSASVYSVTKENINLESGESIIVGGRNFTLVAIAADDRMLIAIDGEKHTLSTIKTGHVNGIYIYPEHVYEQKTWRNASIDLNISMNYTCGNGRCENRWENPENCCMDCNCSGNYTCYRKRCFKSEFIQCYRDAECRDDDPCTEDICTDFPRLCYHRKITECSHGDGCCPGNCTVVEDEDCYVEKPKCKIDADCDDNNTGTINKCSKITNWCYYVLSEVEEEAEKKVEIKNITVEKLIVEKKSFLRRLLDWLGLF